MKTVLVVDDDVDTRLGMHVRLGTSGYVVIFADSGQAAVREALKYLPDVIILDLGLPGMNGLAVMELLRSKSIPIIVISGSADRRKRAIEAGAEAFLVKPVENALLLATMEDVLRKRATPTV